MRPADVEMRFWFAIFGPKGMPHPVKAKLEKAVDKMMNDPAMRDRLAKLDISPDFIPAGRCTPNCNRDPELGEVHRRQGHQAGISRRCAAYCSSACLSTPKPSRGRMGAAGNRNRGMRHAAFRPMVFDRLCARGLPAFAQAQATYPDRPVRFIIAFPPGGATDTFFRVISPEFATALGGSIVIENKGGAGGYIAWQKVAARRPTATPCWWRKTRWA